MEYFMVIMSALCVGVQFNLNKLYSKRTPSSVYATFIFPLITMLAGALIFFCVNKLSLTFTRFGVIMSVFAAVVNAFTLAVGVLATGRGRVSVYTTFMMLGGMILPYLYGLAFLDEDVTWGKIVGMVVLVGALVLSMLPSKEEKQKGGKANTLFIILCAMAFVLNGFNSIIGKVHQTGNGAMQTYDFVVLSFALQAVVAALAIALAYIIKRFKKTQPQGDVTEQNEKKPFVLTWKSALIILAICVGFSAVSGLGYVLNLTAAKTMPASVSYPFISGGSTVFGTLIAAVMFKEKIDLMTVISLVVTVAGTVLFMF